jgi:hypothetical protein
MAVAADIAHRASLASSDELPRGVFSISRSV